MNLGKVANLESTVPVHCTTLLDHVIKKRASYFNTDFVSQMRLTTNPNSLLRPYGVGFLPLGNLGSVTEKIGKKNAFQ